MGFGFGDTVVIGFPAHQTLAQIAERDREISYCRAMDVGGHRLAGRLTLGYAMAAAVAGIAAIAVPVFGVLALLFAAISGYCARIWWIDPPIPTPEPLHIESYSPAENRLLMASQRWEPFWTYSTCPGCGHIDAQMIRRPDVGEPGWAALVRQCGICEREWAEA